MSDAGSQLMNQPGVDSDSYPGGGGVADGSPDKGGLRGAYLPNGTQ